MVLRLLWFALGLFLTALLIRLSPAIKRNHQRCQGSVKIKQILHSCNIDNATARALMDKKHYDAVQEMTTMTKVKLEEATRLRVDIFGDTP